MGGIYHVGLTMENQICPFCRIRQANKTNTHYLTDYIIRTCLNHAGGKVRETGLFVSYNSSQATLEPSFQREVSPSVIEKAYGREPSDAEIESAIAETPYSVDFFFCSECEKVFTQIENDFLGICNSLRGDFGYLKESTLYSNDDWLTVRKFFYLQLWRAHICDDTFCLSDSSADALRSILIGEITDKATITSFPLGVVYLVTKLSKEEKESFKLKGLSEEEIKEKEQALFTGNIVCCVPRENPYIIVMNDFVLFFFDSITDVPPTFMSSVNYAERCFKTYIVNNEARTTFLFNIRKNLLIPEFKRALYDKYVGLCIFYGIEPKDSDWVKFLNDILNADFSLTKYSERTIEEKFKLNHGL